MTTLTTQQKDLIFGTLLGDGNLQTANNGRTWRYRAIQKKEHKNYLFHKYQVLANLCTSPPILGETFDERTNKTYVRYSFQTLTSSSLSLFGNQFYTYCSSWPMLGSRSTNLCWNPISH